MTFNPDHIGFYIITIAVVSWGVIGFFGIIQDHYDSMRARRRFEKEKRGDNPYE